jgi:hypothetical protein
MVRLGKLLRLSGREQRLFLEACFWLGLARLAILLLPFRRIAPLLGRHMHESPHSDTADHVLIDAISWAVRNAGSHMPWECKCLCQAIAAKAMLRLRGIRSTLYLGVAKDRSREIRAHAWLRCGKTILTGRRGMKRFTVVASFAEMDG